jgi:hypothetical protein
VFGVRVRNGLRLCDRSKSRGHWGGGRLLGCGPLKPEAILGRPTVWFNILDSQSGTTSKCLISSSFQFGALSCFIRAAKAHPSTPLCQHCWRWGHSTKACRSQAQCCLQCSGPHMEANHCQLAGCCWGYPLAKPPKLATPEGAPCPHAAHCVNCKGTHSASDQ